MKNGEIKVPIAALVFAVMTAAALFPSNARGQDLDFFPTIVDSTGSLELDFERVNTRKTSANTIVDTHLYSNIERMKIGADGYVYHPRLMIFYANGSLGLQQSSYFAPGQNTRASQLFDEYDLTAILLPEHPYNLEVFTRREIPPPSPYFPERLITSSEGAVFRYKQKTLSLTLSTMDQTLEDHNKVDSKNNSATGTYRIGPFTNQANYTGINTSFSGGETVITSAFFKNDCNFEDVRLDSNVSTSKQVQTTTAFASSLDTDSFQWFESLSLRLPLNLNADLAHAYVSTEQTTPLFQTTTASSRGTTDGATLTHQLYRSLRTVASLNKSTTESTGGDTENTAKSLAFTYTKRIPTGSLLAGYTFLDTTYTRKGSVSIVNETHPSLVPGAFTLNNQAVDQSTLSVFVKDPVTQTLVPLTIVNDYTVQLFGNTLQLTIVNLPIPVNPAFTYSFSVTYSLRVSDSTTDMRSNGVNLNLTLLDGLFNPYFSRLTTDTEVVSGTFFGGNDHTTTSIYGYTLHQQPWLLLFEYTSFESRISPYRNLRSSLEFRQQMSEDVDILAQLLASKQTRPANPGSSEYVNKNTAVALTANKHFLSEHLDLSINGSYVLNTVTGVTTKSYNFNPSLNWHAGNLDVALTMSKAYVVTVGTGKQTYEADSFFLNISRRIF